LFKKLRIPYLSEVTSYKKPISQKNESQAIFFKIDIFSNQVKAVRVCIAIKERRLKKAGHGKTGFDFTPERYRLDRWKLPETCPLNFISIFDFIPIYGYMASSVRIQPSNTSILTPETFWKSEQKTVFFSVI